MGALLMDLKDRLIIVLVAGGVGTISTEDRGS